MRSNELLRDSRGQAKASFLPLTNLGRGGQSAYRVKAVALETNKTYHGHGQYLFVHRRWYQLYVSNFKSVNLSGLI